MEFDLLYYLDMSKDFVIAHPRIIKDASEQPGGEPGIRYDLDKPEANKKAYEKYAARVIRNPGFVLKGILKNYPNAQLVGIGQKVMILDHARKAITYYMVYQTRKISGVTGVYQIIVWRDQFVQEMVGVTEQIMFQYLVKKYPLVTSDRLQTNAGSDLWIRFMTTALNQGYHVWYFDLNQGERVEIPDVAWIRNNRSKVWNAKQYNEGVLMGVSQMNPFSATKTKSSVEYKFIGSDSIHPVTEVGNIERFPVQAIEIEPRYPVLKRILVGQE